MLQPCRKTAVRLPGPSTSEKGIILLTGCAAPELVAASLAVAGRDASARVAPKVVSVAVKVTIAQLFSLVAHANLALAKVVSGEVTQAVVSGVLKDNVAGLELLHLGTLC